MVKHIFRSKKNLSGDSIIEVLIAVAIFSAIAVAALGIMNQGLENAQSSLEMTIVRTEMDTQAERIRFLADSVVSDPGDSNVDSSNSHKWNAITENALATSGTDTDAYTNFINNYKTAQLTSCQSVISSNYHAFVLDGANVFQGRIEENSSSSAIPSVNTGGLFVVTVKSPNEDTSKNPDYYDFYINTCWDAPGANIPTKLSTTIRIQNPKYTGSEPASEVSTDAELGTGTLKIVYHWKKDDEDGPDDIKSNIWHSKILYSNGYNTKQKTATFTLEKSGNGSYTELGVINKLAYSNSNYTFDGWHTDSLSYTCSETGCEWDDVTSGDKSTIHLFAKWNKNKKYLYCINYQIKYQGPKGNDFTKFSGPSAGSFDDNGEGFVIFNDSTRQYVYCEESPENSNKTLPVHMAGAKLNSTEINNFKFYGWRTDNAVWTGDYPNTTYYDANKVIKTEGETGRTITVNTAQKDDGNSKTLRLDDEYYNNYEAVYYTTLYPHWRAIIDVNGDSFDACRKGGNNANCSIAAIANYQTEGLKFFSDKRKLLDAYTYSTTYGRVYYDNESIATSNNYIKIESYDDVAIRAAAINFGIIKIGTTAYDETHRLAKTDVSWFGLNVDSAASMTNFKPSPGSGKFYYSLFSSNYQSERKIKNSDVVYVSYRLADEENGDSFSISPSAESDSLCWHVFALDSDDKAIYFSNTVTGQSTATQCGGTFDLGLPF